MENRKRKKFQADLFSPDAIRSRLSSRKQLQADIESYVRFFRSVDLREVDNVKEDEALLILSSKLTWNGLSVLKLAMNHVPSTYTMRCREFQGFPLRTVLVHKIVTACCSLSSLDSLADVHFYISFIEKYCTEFLSTPEVLPLDKMWKLCENGGYHYNKFLSPPLQSCLNCGEGITMHNPPSKAKLFTLEGPIPASKITLECKVCKISYGITKFTDNTGAHFYPKSISSNVIEMTNTSYMTQELYRWIPSLSNHSWVSFSGFSESYNEVYFKEIDRFFNTLSVDKDGSEDDEKDDPESSSTGVITGELSAKLAAKSYWKKELEEELNDLGIREKWSFNKTSVSTYSGSEEEEVECNKDTGGRKTLHCWSRGIFFIVSGGGHIEYWQPLYRSESPTQAFLIFAVWLYRRFKTLQDAGKPLAEIESAMQSTVLAYDNMCHVDNLKISKKNLPFPEPFEKAWQLVTKVIDRLHLRNHKNQKCKTLYNPEGKIPSEFNTMSCEQTFVWASRMKKIICAMTRLHQFFFIHRSVKRRNKYTELCHKRNKTPVLPKLPLLIT